MTTLDGPSYAHLHLSNPMFRPLYLPSTFDKTFLVPLFSCANLASVLFHVPVERTAFVVLFLIPNLLVSTRACWWWSLFPSSLCCLGSGFSFSPPQWVGGWFSSFPSHRDLFSFHRHLPSRYRYLSEWIGSNRSPWGCVAGRGRCGRGTQDGSVGR